jgi:hypothetical protein
MKILCRVPRRLNQHTHARNTPSLYQRTVAVMMLLVLSILLSQAVTPSALDGFVCTCHTSEPLNVISLDSTVFISTIVLECALLLDCFSSVHVAPVHGSICRSRYVRLLQDVSATGGGQRELRRAIVRAVLCRALRFGPSLARRRLPTTRHSRCDNQGHVHTRSQDALPDGNEVHGRHMHNGR